MKHLLRLLILLTLAAMAAGSLPAQDLPAGGQDSAPPPEAPSFQPGEVRMHYYRPRNLSVGTLVDPIQRIYGRNIRVAGQGAARGGRISSIFTLEDAVVVYDTDEYARQVLAAMKGMDAAFARQDAPDEDRGYQVFEYTPRAISLTALQEALRPFQSSICTTQNQQAVGNITFVAHPPTVVIRDTATRGREILDFLGRLDRPPPQMLVTCWVIEGVADAEAGHALPPVLVSNLRQLLPYEHYDLVAMGVLRSGVAIDGGLSLSMHNEGRDSESRLHLEATAHDPEGRTLSVRDCSFEISSGGRSRQIFATSTTLKEGEYSVLGVTGGQPLFVVLRVTPVAD